MAFLNPANLGLFAAHSHNYDSPLLESDHYILKKLCNEVLPWIIAGRLVKRQWFVRLAVFYDYTSSLAAALAGLGVGAPIAAFISSDKAEPGKPLFDTVRDVLPPQWFIAGIVGVLVWVGIRLVVQQQNVLSRALLARDCSTYMRGLHLELWSALSDSEPLPKIREIQKKTMDKVQSAVLNQVWPYENGSPPQEAYWDQRTKNVVDIRGQFMAGWRAMPNEALRQ